MNTDNDEEYTSVASEQIVELSMLRTNEFGTIASIYGGEGIRNKLAMHGLEVGGVIRVISNCGPVTVDVNRTTTSIGRGMARKILVRRGRS
ncbi:MAG TPA: ferrous iron transport protein A [Methanomicrobia archaeon]|nr:ferrous iron transport protein A [Methanomicrobia archaeon]